MNKVYIIHDTDTDGSVAAAMLASSLTGIPSITLIGVGHGSSFTDLQFKDLEIPEGSTVYVLDHEMSPKRVAELFKQCKPAEVVIVDHHPKTGQLYSHLDAYEGRLSFIHGEKDASTTFLVYEKFAKKPLFDSASLTATTVNVYDCWLFGEDEIESVYAVGSTDEVETYSVTKHLSYPERVARRAKALNSLVFSKQLRFGEKKEGAYDFMLMFTNPSTGQYREWVKTEVINGYEEHTYAMASGYSVMSYSLTRPSQALTDKMALEEAIEKKAESIGESEVKANQIAETNTVICKKTICGKKYTFGMVFSSDIPNEIAEAVLVKNTDLDFAAVVYLKPNEKMYKFSLRSSWGREPIGELAQHYGGGGHRNAAGFQLNTAGFTDFLSDIEYQVK